MTEQPAVAPHQAIVRIVNKRGLHARASAKFVTLAAAFTARVVVAKDGSEVAGTSIMGLMMLAAALGDEIHISAHGPDAAEALAALVALVGNRFDEGE
ncbi:HPr family phosphocarrier protein [Hankyongella ginsenosidimutans]|uniref:HPr family phosphocarrier protein n=1 Tax=Hankyongella ginsenosidimutans TaxID=1763828 RepID=UPI001FE93CCD|nr:HPr family phosphocarrier protein [Hankyongella ginsenosidimutans]